MPAIDLEKLTDEELEALRGKASEEQWRRKCGAYLPGLQGCDQGKDPHDVHGYDYWNADGEQVRVSWTKKKED